MKENRTGSVKQKNHNLAKKSYHCSDLLNGSLDDLSSREKRLLTLGTKDAKIIVHLGILL